jgi:ABC-type multidrug transport system permease subunit
MCDAGLTVVTAIHQPSSQMFTLFDDLMILVEGCVTYNGPATKAVPYFASIGFKCNRFFNPADFIMGLILEEELKKQGGSSMKEDLIRYWKNHEGTKEIGHIKSEKDKRLLEEFQKKQDEFGTPTYTTSYFEQVSILTRRSFYQTKGQSLNFTDMLQTILISIAISLLWWQLPNNVSNVNDRVGVIFFVSTYVSLFFPAFKALLAFPLERAVILRERTSGSYRLSAYFISKAVTELPFMWEHPILMIIITYFTTALLLRPANFFIFFGVSLVSVLTSSSLGLLISAIWGSDFGNAQITLTVVAMMLFLTGGFFVQHIPYWMMWAYYISYIKYSTDALILNEFLGSYWTNDPNSTTFFNQTIVTGEQILDTMLAVDIQSIGLNVLILFGWGVFFRVLAFLALRHTMKVPKPNSKKKKCCYCIK